ncbi:hypothetical protein IGI37_003348 [Enterococcus sp. AZ194]|uniref:hypothetical protein n=1 Tax=Enterococcus sp. AZ194 TaxID=2774629 RepID=UPI003F214118
MKKFTTLSLSLVTVLSPFLMSVQAVAETNSSDEISKSSVMETGEGLSSNQSSTQNYNSSESSATTNEDEGKSSQETVPESKKEKKKFKVTFKTDTKHNFSSDTTEIEVEKESDSTLSAEEIPATENLDGFVGWRINGALYTTEVLRTLEITSDTEIQAEFETVKATSTKIKSNTSIKDIIAPVRDKTQVIIVPDPTSGNAYKEYAASEAGIKSAINDLYQKGSGEDYVLYIGKNTTVSADTVAKTKPATVTAANATFYSLQGKVGTLTITGNSEDPINIATEVPVNSSTLTVGGLSTAIHFGTNIQFRNIKYSGKEMFMNGNSLTLNGGASGNGLSIYGGTDEGNVTGNPTITVETTGTGTWNFYGGNKTGGTLTGNTSVVIKNVTKTIDTVSGGAESGTIKGNTSVRIENAGATISNIYGGGKGTASKPANVTGDVVTEVVSTVKSAPNNLKVYYGGVVYGNIDGSVTNNILGYGSWSGTTNYYYGGSKVGNIGSSKTTPGITTTIDTSQFTSGRAYFVGANETSGVIKGRINNVIKAGGTNQGSFNRIDGAAGNSIKKEPLVPGGLNPSVADMKKYDAMTNEERRAYARETASFSVYGDISTKILEGSVSYALGDNVSYTRAAGFAGYIEGNTSVEVGVVGSADGVGGEGFVYGQKGDTYRTTPLSYSNSTPKASRPTYFHSGEIGFFDIVGGGGSTDVIHGTEMYIYGDTSAVLNNVLARWTYGGSFAGVIEGNTSMTMNGGMVDTLEGGGYSMRRIYGNSRATINNGQVDWFLTGGGWDDEKIVGNAGVTVYDGVINASVGGSYGLGIVSKNIVTGDTKNYIYGGDFSGTNSATFAATKEALASGPTFQDSIYGAIIEGNTELTIDLRNYDGEFRLPTGTSISAGVPYGNNRSEVGKDSSKTITLNIYTKPGSDALDGASIYGDGAVNASQTKSGSITMNIQASGSKIGHLYATNYKNVLNNQILRDVKMNIQGLSSIQGLSGGNPTDNFTDSIVANSSNKSIITVGANVDGTNQYQKEDIKVNGVGIVNFTSLDITNGMMLTAENGNIKNGSGATAANHATTYNTFGDTHLSKGAGLGISTSTGMFSLGKLTVEDEGTIESVPGAGKINITDFETPDESKDRLTWVSSAPKASAMVSSTGTWFGKANAFQVLTVNPTIKNATKIKPANFTGRDKETGKTYIGDNDVTKSGSGYGIAIPGSFIDYEVEMPGIADGDGTISHDVTQVKPNNQPLTLDAWGTEVANTQVKKGRLVVPLGTKVLPTLTFTPETVMTGSWLYSANITSTKIRSTDIKIDEKPNSDPGKWTSSDGEYSYSIKVKYSNKAEVSGKHVFVRESEAKTITKDSIYAYLSAAGRPSLKDNITDKLISEIQQPLGLNDVSREHKVTYTSGKTAVNQVSETYNLVVVRDESEISKDRSTALYAKSTRFKLEEANALADDVELNTHTWARVLFADGKASVKPTIDAAAFDAIKYVTAPELSKNVPTRYSYVNEAGTIDLVKIVNVLISGELKLVETPDVLNFGNQRVTNTEKTYWPTITGNLAVEDTRGGDKGSWYMTVAETKPLTSATIVLDKTMYFENGPTDYLIGKDAVVVEATTLQEDGTYVISNQWGESKNQGIKLKVPVGKQRLGSYEGTLTWTLVTGPGN